ncbi:MAG: TOBE domain-containing protein [Thermoleophilia bacterium]|nr:TOBE domain-containing protein [Thermoleophilia bacterium]
MPSDIYLSSTRPPGTHVNGFEAEVVGLEERRDGVRLTLLCHNNILVAEVPKALCAEMELEPGKQVFVILKLRRIRTYET